VTVKIDTTAPAISASGVATDSVSRSALKVTLTATDGASGPAAIAYTLDSVSHTAAASVTIDVARDAHHILAYHSTGAVSNSGAGQTPP
jgi:hypothetical protein